MKSIFRNPMLLGYTNNYTNVRFCNACRDTKRSIYHYIVTHLAYNIDQDRLEEICYFHFPRNKSGLIHNEALISDEFKGQNQFIVLKRLVGNSLNDN